MEVEFNVIIPAAYKDFQFLSKTIRYVEDNINPKQVFVMLDIRLSHYVPQVVKNNNRVKLVDENEVVPGVSFRTLRSLLLQHGLPTNRTGWFLQQFLKLGFCFSDLCDTEYYLTWDADTLPLRKINFFDKNGSPIFTKKKEYNQAYFDTLSKLLTLPKIADFSYIAEHMVFSKYILKEMLSEIENSEVEGDVWYEKIVKATDSSEINSFSEFETYGNYCLNHYPQKYKTQTLNTFRKAGYIAGRFISDKKLHYMAFDLDIASFELGDYPCGVEKFICYGYHKYLGIKEKIIKNKLRNKFK